MKLGSRPERLAGERCGGGGERILEGRQMERWGVGGRESEEA
jgi:hypothetical protein